MLVVDDDPECLAEYVETIGALGYSCRGLGGAAEALRLIAVDSGIGIVVTDVQMPGMDGLTLLEELSSRFMVEQPLVTLVVTGQASLENAVQAMRSSALDFLSKPVTVPDISAALRRASLRWHHLVGQLRLRTFARLAKEREVPGATDALPVTPPGLPVLMQDGVRNIMRSRRKRLEFLDSELFSDPAWDILLDLTSAALDGKPVPVSSACAASHVPFSTALRHVRQLVDAGLVRRWQDPVDKRRALLELQPEAFEAMKGYLLSLCNQQKVG